MTTELSVPITPNAIPTTYRAGQEVWVRDLPATVVGVRADSLYDVRLPGAARTVALAGVHLRARETE